MQISAANILIASQQAAKAAPPRPEAPAIAKADSGPAMNGGREAGAAPPVRAARAQMHSPGTADATTNR